MTPQEQFEHDGAQQWLINYPLDSASVVFDVGGYLGEWTNELLTARDHGVCSHCGGRQNPYVYIFEPVHEFALSCRNRFRDYHKVDVCQIALGNFTHRDRFTVNGSATNAFDKSHPHEPVEVMDVDAFTKMRGITRIELVSINIEGMEYELLNRMIDCGVANMCRNIQVQFHQGLHASRNREKIQERLRETHELVWCYDFIWESWRRKTVL